MRNFFRQMAALLWLIPLASLVFAHEGSDYNGQHMMWQGYGLFFGPMIMIVFFAVLITVSILLYRWLGGTAHHQSMGSYPNSDRDPVNILKERFAKGEIDKEEFEERKRLLREK
jgi:putative membrane protein